MTLGKEGKIVLEKKKTLTVIHFNENEQKWTIKEKADEIWMACDRKIELKTVHRFKLDKDIFDVYCSDL